MVRETIVFQAADGEDLMIPACTVFDWSTSALEIFLSMRYINLHFAYLLTRVTDRRTDRQTDRQNCDGKTRWKQ